MTTNKCNIDADPELFRDLINKSNDSIFVADPPTGLFIFVNDKACTGLGYDRRELLEMGVMDIETTLPDNFSWQAHVNELRQKGSLIFEGAHKREDGNTFPVEANISYVLLNTREYLVTVVRDITERKRVEAELRTREKQLTESQRISHVGSWEHNLKTGDVFLVRRTVPALRPRPEKGLCRFQDVA
jgi:PAS domain S-box-containing protein